MAPLVGSAHLHAAGRRPRGARQRRPGRRSRRSVVVIGAGVAGSNAAAVAVGMHAEVAVLDRNLARLRALDHDYQGRLDDRRVERPRHRGGVPRRRPRHRRGAVVGRQGAPARQRRARRADAARVRARRHLGRPGRLLRVDAARRPTRTRRSGPRSVFYCVANMPGAVPHTSTHALTNATLPYTIEIAQHGWREAARQDAALALGVNVVGGARHLRARRRGARSALPPSSPRSSPDAGQPDPTESAVNVAHPDGIGSRRRRAAAVPAERTARRCGRAASVGACFPHCASRGRPGEVCDR